MARHIIEEADRCLQCPKPRCQTHCPAGTPVNQMVALVMAGKIEEAGKLLFDNNPLSIVCSLVCPHENQCEGNCVLGAKGKSIHVSTIEHYVSDYYLDMVQNPVTIDPQKKVAIIGSGPAGLTIAVQLALRGFDITIFEAHDQIGGVLRYGIPEFRLPKSILDRYCAMLARIGVKVRPNILIGPYLTVDDLLRDGYKAVFIGTGVWNPRTLAIPGESLGHVHFAIDYLKNPDACRTGKRVVVIGAGNVAVDVARTAVRKGGRDVRMVYRRDEATMSARPYELEYARLDGVHFEFFQRPVCITDEGVILVSTQLDAAGELQDIAGSEHLLPADTVIVAVSQGPRANIVKSTTGLDIARNGLLQADDYGRTSRPGIFASGDIVTGAKTVVEAVKWSKVVASTIAEWVEHG